MVRSGQTMVTRVWRCKIMDTKCQFCGSEKIKVPTPFIKLGNSGEYEEQFNYCCLAQKQNRKFAKEHLDTQTREPIFSDEEIAKE